jgi:DNA-binding beta-propeller fold protein YncE
LSEINNSKLAAYDRTATPYDPAAPPSKDFRGPLVSLRMSVDGLLYVSDRTNNRIQVFEKTGKFVKEFFVAPNTLGEGVPWALAFSHDPKQKYLFVGDGMTNLIWILNRVDGSVVGTIGHKGHNGGQFDKIDGIALDRNGNMYVGEVHYNNRIQKFSLENK